MISATDLARSAGRFQIGGSHLAQLEDALGRTSTRRGREAVDPPERVFERGRAAFRGYPTREPLAVDRVERTPTYRQEASELVCAVQFWPSHRIELLHGRKRADEWHARSRR